MDKIEKLLRKISRKERLKLLELVEAIMKRGKNLKMQKIKNTNFYKARYGNFRAIFHYERDEAVIDSVRLRNEKTDKDY